MIRLATLMPAIAVRPGLWPTACRQYRRTCPTGWWRRRPFLPLPDRRYLAFRMLTQYGSSGHAPDPSDVLNYLAWCRRWDQYR